MILDKIIKQKKIQLKEEMSQISINEWKTKLEEFGSNITRDFYKSIKRKDISIIAEIKKASPSKGIISNNFDPINIANEYSNEDIQAISVLTEKNFFQGNDEYLKKIMEITPLPLLRKDFIIELWQVYQSKFLGADAILLIVSILTDVELEKFQKIANTLGMECLVEVKNKEEIKRAIDCGANIIGINNRDLNTFNVDIKNTENLIKFIPKNIAIVSESGIKTSSDLKYLKEVGADAVLIGETLMRADSIKNKIKDLRCEHK